MNFCYISIIPLVLYSIPPQALIIKLDKAFALILGESILLPQLANNLGTQSLPVSQHKEIVASQVNGMISGLITQRLVVDKDTFYEADLHLDKGQATINGQATALSF